MFLLSGFIFIILAPFTFADVCEPCGFNINEIVEIHGAGLACDEENGELTAEERLDCMVTKLSDKYCRSCICMAVCKLGMIEECNVCNTCPTDTSFYEDKCITECTNFKGDIHENAETCLTCLQTTVPSSCAQVNILFSFFLFYFDLQETPITTTCSPTSNLCSFQSGYETCKICILTIFGQAFPRCDGEGIHPGNTTTCMEGYMREIHYDHCIECVCWALCQFRMEEECQWCRKSRL